MKVLYAGKSLEINQYDKHTHNNAWEITLMLTGEAEITVGGKTFDVKANDIIVIPPDVCHEGVSDCIFTDIFFSADNMDFSDITVVHDYDGSTRSLFFLIEKTMSEKENNYRAVASALAETICEFVKKYSKTYYKYDFVVEIKNKIYENLSNPDFNISEEVRLLGFNTDYFRRCFREELGETPLEYMTSLRMGLARRLLLQRTFQSVERVAHLCGFNDSFYFSKIFKKHMGCSPKEYRNSNTEKWR